MHFRIFGEPVRDNSLKTSTLGANTAEKAIETPDSRCPSGSVGSDNRQSLAVDYSELSQKIISYSNDSCTPHNIRTNGLDLIYAEDDGEIWE